jgi:uncharacterized membrane protein YphA (DoxX/SURF4 family)
MLSIQYSFPLFLDIPFLIPFALQMALIVVIAEVILGVLLLLGIKTKTTLNSLMLMIVFFTFLTFYSAYFNKVTDCGCFGDAIKLTPWESFTKDVILLVLIGFLLFQKKYIQPIFTAKIGYGLLTASTLGCIFLGYWVLNHLPIIDFRAYQVGTNIMQGMVIPDDAEQSVYEMVFIYKVNGVDTEISYDDVMAGNVPEKAEFVDRKDKLIKQGYIPPIHDFTIEMDGSDYTQDLLKEPKLIMLISYDLKKVDEDGLAVLEAFHQKAKSKGFQVIGMTSSDKPLIDAAKKQHGLTFDYYFCDATTLKTIERANPSIVVIKNGTIVEKKHFNDIEKVNLD